MRPQRPAIIVRLNPTSSEDMQPIDNREPRHHWLGRVLTDVHFWVPVAVLMVACFSWNPFTKVQRTCNLP